MDDKILEEVEEIIKNEGWYEYCPEKHREHLKTMLQKKKGTRDSGNFDPWMYFFKGEDPLFNPLPEEQKVRVSFGEGIFYISLKNFLSYLALNEVKAAVKLAVRSESSVVLDLRDNGGGFLDLCLETAVLFQNIRKEDILLTQRYKDEEKITRMGDIRGCGENIFNKARPGKLAVLVNEWSASASELFAGILQQWGFPVVGEKTYGKGVSQKRHSLSDGSGLRLTISEIFAGNGRLAWHKVGIEPDYYVRDNRKMFPGLTATPKDRQFMKAVEVLGKMK